MTVDITRRKATNQNELVDGTRDRMILECKDLQITATSLENPQEWKGSAWDVEIQSTSWDRQKCSTKNVKCKECHKIRHFHKVCQSKKRGKRANLVQATTQDDNETHIEENGVRQPNPPVVNMLKLVNHIRATTGPQGKHLKFPIDIDPRGPYKHHLVVRVDTGTDVNCMNEKTFKELFPEVKLSVCPHKIQNFGNCQLWTFQYWNSFAPTSSLGEKGI